MNKIDPVSPLQAGGNIVKSLLFEQSIDSNAKISAISYGNSRSLLFCNFNIRSVAIVATVCGNSSKEFSETMSSSSISNRPTSMGSFFSLLLFTINFFNRFKRPISGGNATSLLNDARSSLTRRHVSNYCHYCTHLKKVMKFKKKTCYRIKMSSSICPGMLVM